MPNRGWALGETRAARLAVLGGVLAFALVAAEPSHVLGQQAVRVVLASTDPTLEAELRVALAPWAIELIVAADAPGAAMPSSAGHSEALAITHQAAAVTWISRDDQGAFALWIYDRRSGRVMARPLPSGPPFDEPTAASVALAIKTLLRHSDAAPPAERSTDPTLASEVRLELGGGARALATSPGDVEPRFALGVCWWPRALDDVLGISLDARAGAGVGLSTAALAARLGGVDVHVGARVRATPLPILDLVVGLEVGVTLAWLDATVRADARHTVPTGVDPSGYLWAEVGLRALPSLRIALRAGAFTTLRTRSYLVRGEVVAETQPVAPFAELLLELPLDGGRVDSP